MRVHFLRGRLVAVAVAMVSAVVPVVAAGGGPSAAGEALPVPAPFIDVVHPVGFRPTAGPCNSVPFCYQPSELQAAYNLTGLYGKGLNGRGSTIAVVDSFGSPTIAGDLHQFDAQFGLADPKLTIIAPAGSIPPFTATSERITWALETTLDVEWSHSMAPGAHILLVETPIAETEGVQGFPEIVKAENYVLKHHLADVITQSFGATEETFPSPTSLKDLRTAYKNAKKDNVSVLASSGDTGATNYKLNGTSLYKHRVTGWPSTDPLVTSVGGTSLDLTSSGARVKPDVLWGNGSGASGGGVSSIFTRPSYQDPVSAIVGTQRGTPDVALSADPNAGADIYATFQGAGGWSVIGGTSEASPLFAGIVAIADQKAGHSLGLLNTKLYAAGAAAAEVDITSGNNSFAGVTGYQAVPGYDMAGGLGTVDGQKLVKILAS